MAVKFDESVGRMKVKRIKYLYEIRLNKKVLGDNTR
jgi:hypothetical protein